MPFRHLFPEQAASHDFHGQYAFQGQNPQLAIVDPESIDYTGWHEMDFTTTPLTSSTVTLDSQKYSYAMNKDQADPLAYLRSSPNNRHGSTGSLINSPSHRQTSAGSRRASQDIYSSNQNQYSFSQFLDMDANLSPLNQPRLTSRTDEDSNMTNNETELATTLSASDSVRTSAPIDNLDPIDISIAARTDSTEKLCPLIAGQVDRCQPSKCGPDAPCMNFTTLPPIEECTSVPCIRGSMLPDGTMINNDGMSVELHSRPSMSTRTSTATSSKSSNTRRSSSSTATTEDTHPDVVPLPPRKSTTRRQTRASTKVIPITAAVLSDNEDEEDATLPEKKPTSKPTAPSKSDAKQRAKQAHSLVERKYRENLNAKIVQLHRTLQNSYYGPQFRDRDEEFMEQNAGNANSNSNSARDSGLPASKARKSDVLTDAMNYVNQTEVEMRHMENEIYRLNERVRVLEKLVRCEDCSLLKQMVGLQVEPM